MKRNTILFYGVLLIITCSIEKQIKNALLRSPPLYEDWRYMEKKNSSQIPWYKKSMMLSFAEVFGDDISEEDCDDVYSFDECLTEKRRFHLFPDWLQEDCELIFDRLKTDRDGYVIHFDMTMPAVSFLPPPSFTCPAGDLWCSGK